MNRKVNFLEIRSILLTYEIKLQPSQHQFRWNLQSQEIVCCTFLYVRTRGEEGDVVDAKGPTHRLIDGAHGIPAFYPPAQRVSLLWLGNKSAVPLATSDTSSTMRPGRFFATAASRSRIPDLPLAGPVGIVAASVKMEHEGGLTVNQRSGWSIGQQLRAAASSFNPAVIGF